MLNGEGADVVKNAVAGLTCNAGDHKELAKAVLNLSKKSSEERKAMGANGLALSASEFGRGSLINRLEGWLQSLSFPASATKKRSEAR
ncbi:hypothetical protein D3C71_2039190 [compost metagenome]